MDLATALRHRPLAIVASSQYSAACTNLEALEALHRQTSPELSADEHACAPWLLGARLKRQLGGSLGHQLLAALHKEELPEVARLCALPIDLVLTTSLGDGWERAFVGSDKMVHSIQPGQSPDYDYDAVVYHLFGRAQDPDFLLLSDSEIDGSLRNTEMQSLLQAWWASRVFVFLGFSTAGDELRFILQRLVSDEGGGEHFAYIPGLSMMERSELREQFSLHVLDDPSAAVSSLEELLQGARLVARESADLDALMARAALDANDPAVATGFELLEHRLRQDGSYERLVDVHVARLSVAEEPSERQEILLQTASLLEHKMRDVDRAFHATLSAYREMGDKHLWPALRRRASSAEAKELLADALMDSRNTLRQQERLPALLLALECYRDVGATVRAIEAIERSAIDPTDNDDLMRLHLTVLEEAERWYELTRALERAADQSTYLEDREQHLLARAAVLQNRLNEPWAAIECYQQVLSLNPGNSAALEATEELYLHLHQVPALLDLLYDYGTRYDKSELVAKLWRIGERCRSRGDHTGALLCFEKLRDEEPGNEQLLAVLSDLYAELGETSQLVEILKAKVGNASPGSKRAVLCRQLALAHEELEHVDEAAECWEWVIHDDPGSEEAVGALERLYRRSQSWQPMLALFSRQRAHATEKTRWLIAMADVYEEKLAELGPAIELLTEVHELDPNNSDISDRVYRLLEQAGRHGDSARLSDALAQQAHGGAQAHLYSRAASCWQQHKDLVAAIKSMEAATKAQPNTAELHASLAKLHQDQGEHRLAAEEYDRASMFSTGASSTKWALAASHCFEALDATDRGIEVLEHRWLSGTEERVVAVELRRLYEARGRHADLISLLERQNERVRKEEQVEQFLAMADAHAALGQWNEEIACMQRAVKASPERADIARQLAEAALGRKMYDIAEATCHHLLDGDISIDDQAATYCLLARRSFELDDREAALAFLAKARERVPFDRRALALLVELSASQPEAQLGYLHALLLDAPLSEKTDLLMRIGDVCTQKLDERGEGRDAYQSALSLNPCDHLLLHRCLAISVEDGEWDESLEYLGRLVETEDDPIVRARYRATTAHLYEEELDDVETAIKLLWQASEDAPSDQNVLRRLAGHLRAKKDWPAFLECTSRLLAALRDDLTVMPDVHARTWVDLAEACMRELDDKDTALCSLEVAVNLQPRSLDYRCQLASLYEDDRRWAEAVAQHQAILDLDPSQLSSYQALTRLYDGLGEAEAADACLEASKIMAGEAPAAVRTHAPKRKPLSHDLLQSMRHEDDSLALGRVLALMTPAIATVIAAPQRKSPKPELLLDEGHPIVVRIEALAECLGVLSPLVYLETDAAEPVQASVLRDDGKLLPVLIIDEATMANFDSNRVTFALARTLVSLRREYLVRAVQPDSKSLARALDAILELGQAEPGDSISKTASAFRDLLGPLAFDQVRKLAIQVSADGRSGLKIVQSWIRSSSLTAARIALWVTADLSAAIAGLEDFVQTEAEAEESRIDMLRIFCSPQLREVSLKPARPLTEMPLETQDKSPTAKGKSRSMRAHFRNVARTVTEEIRLDSLSLD